uniref:BMP and activin membrane-bound inhibitor-like protein n=1 Tax=Magallana gigas TaxID=29159 RepID=A0A8W8MAK2_MAGGI
MYFTGSTLSSTLIVAVFALSINNIHGEIRCRCNEPECVSSGTQICKSSNIKMCYVMKTFDEGTGTPRYTHGCMDALVKNEKYKNICDTDSETNKPAENFVTYRHDPIVQCCNKDLCNYNNIVMAVPTNRSLAKADPVSPGPPEYIFPHSIPEDTRSANQDKDLWFKAAVIAVPIAGGFILVLLVLLAVRMLRADTRRHRQFIEFRRERTSLTKAHLYVTDHFSEKVGRTSPFFGGMHNPLCKDTLVNNARMKKDGKLYEKVNTKPEVHRAQTPIIIWGKPSHRDFATVV